MSAGPAYLRCTEAGWSIALRPNSMWPRCDCGAPATHEVTFRQLRTDQNEMNSALALCVTCLAEFCKDETPLSVQPLVAPVNERGIILRSNPNESTTECHAN